jgi:hypothetical protein
MWIDLYFSPRASLGTEVAEEKVFPFSADPSGISFAFHGTGTAEKGKT